MPIDFTQARARGNLATNGMKLGGNATTGGVTLRGSAKPVGQKIIVDAEWGQILGNIENQTDLMDLLEIKEDKFFVHTQLVPSNTWNIQHPLDKFPSVTVVDSAGTVVVGDVSFVDADNIVIRFNSPFSGKAYLN